MRAAAVANEVAGDHVRASLARQPRAEAVRRGRLVRLCCTRSGAEAPGIIQPPVHAQDARLGRRVAPGDRRHHEALANVDCDLSLLGLMISGRHPLAADCDACGAARTAAVTLPALHLR